MTDEREAMTLEQVRDVLRQDFGYPDLCLPTHQARRMADAIDAHIQQVLTIDAHLSRAAEPVGWQFLGTSSINGPFPAPTWKECADPVEAEKAGYEVRAIYTRPSEDARDAKRYRWLRGDGIPNHSVRWARWEVRQWDGKHWNIHPMSIGPDLDHEIDAAMAKENGNAT